MEEREIPEFGATRVLVVADGPRALEEALAEALRDARPNAEVTIAVLGPGHSPFLAFAPLDVAALSDDGATWASEVAREAALSCPPGLRVRHLALPDGGCRRLAELAERTGAEVVVLRVGSRRLRRRWARSWPGQTPTGPPGVPAALSG